KKLIDRIDEVPEHKAHYDGHKQSLTENHQTDE
ncbi:MAG: hypothetical protein ACJA0J_001367, partial [Bdellovibrionota bacterium]